MTPDDLERVKALHAKLLAPAREVQRRASVSGRMGGRMKRMIRRTIVVEYESAYDLGSERRDGLENCEAGWIAWWPQDAEITETVEEITEHSHCPPDGVSGRVDQ